MEIEVCSSSESETELGVATPATAPSLLDRLRCPARSETKDFYVVVFNEFSASKMLYYASTMLNAFGFYYAQNYAGIIRQGLVKWQSSDLIASLKSITKNNKNIAVSHQTLPSARREKRRSTRLRSCKADCRLWKCLCKLGVNPTTSQYRLSSEFTQVAQNNRNHFLLCEITIKETKKCDGGVVPSLDCPHAENQSTPRMDPINCRKS